MGTIFLLSSSGDRNSSRELAREGLCRGNRDLLAAQVYMLGSKLHSTACWELGNPLIGDALDSTRLRDGLSCRLQSTRTS